MTQNELDTLESNRNRIQSLQSQLDSLCEPIGAVPMTGMPSGGGGKNAVEELVARKDDIRDRINGLQRESNRICFGIEPPHTRRVFVLFYVDVMTWDQVADELGYSEGKAAQTVRNRYLKKFGLKVLRRCRWY